MPSPFHSFTLSLAGIDFLIESPEVPLVPRAHDAYVPFLKTAAEARTDGPRVTLTLDEAPAGDGWEPLFATGETWSMSARGSRRRLDFRTPDGRPLWTAVIGEGASRTTVFCRPCLGEHGGSPALENPVRYPLDQILLAQALGRGGALLHAAAAVRGGRAAALAGSSGAGKTTLSALLGGAGFLVLSDDRAVARSLPGATTLFGTPWAGEGGQAVNAGAPLAALIFLAKGPGNELRRLPGAECLARLLPVATVAWYDPPLMDATLHFLGRLVEGVPAFEFAFAPGEGAAAALAALLDGLG